MYAQEMIQLIQSGRQGQTAAPDAPAQLCQTCAELSQSQLSKNNTGVNLRTSGVGCPEISGVGLRLSGRVFSHRNPSTYSPGLRCCGTTR